MIETAVVSDNAGGDLVVCFGSSEGFPLLVHSGTPGSQVLDPRLALLADEFGFRLIGYDRPGYGNRRSRPDRRVAHAALDAAVIADALAIERFATWGFSGGGPFALACAALLPNRVVAACVFASLGPSDAPGLDFAAGKPQDLRDEIDLFFTDPAAARQKHRSDGIEMLVRSGHAKYWMARWGECAGADAAHSQPHAEFLAANMREAARQEDQGWWEDWSAFLNPWGFDLRDIHRPVQLWQGGQDLAVGLDHGKWLAQRIPDVDAHILPDEDHSTIEFNHRRDALQWLRRYT